MSDRRLREAERLLAQIASVEHEAAYLRARRDAGLLPLVRLQAAARLEYPPALLALDGTEPPTLGEGILSLGKEAALRWSAAIVRASLPTWEATHADPRPRAALAIVDRWIAATPGRERGQARRDAQRLSATLIGVAHAAGEDPQDQGEAWVFRAAVVLLGAVAEDKRGLRRAFDETMLIACGIPEPNTLLQAAAQEFVPWLLGDRLHCLEQSA